jgi:hypothetical protein
MMYPPVDSLNAGKIRGLSTDLTVLCEYVVLGLSLKLGSCHWSCHIEESNAVSDGANLQDAVLLAKDRRSMVTGSRSGLFQNELCARRPAMDIAFAIPAKP